MLFCFSLSMRTQMAVFCCCIASYCHARYKCKSQLHRYCIASLTDHYENLPMQYRVFFSVVKIEKFHLRFMIFFSIFAPTIDCGYTLELPRRGGSNENPQFMFSTKNKKNMFTPAYPNFTNLRGHSLHRPVFSMFVFA